MKIIIPASGIGKRFIDAGYKNTKPLIDVTEEKKIIDYVVDMFDRENDEFFIITSKQTTNEMQAYLELMNINFNHFSLDESQAGPVGAIAAASTELSKYIDRTDEVIVSYCDFGMEWDYNDFKSFINETKPDGCIPCYTGYHPHLEPEENVYAAVKLKDGEFQEIIEKHKSDDKYNELWSPGVYYFKRFSLLCLSFIDMIGANDSLNGEYYASLLYNHLPNHKVTVYDKIDKFYQFGTPKDFEQAKEMINTVSINNNSLYIKNTVVLAAGKGERFLKLAYAQPKPFIPLGDSDFISKILWSLPRNKSNLYCIGSQKDKVFWDNSNIEKFTLIEPNKIGAAFSYKSGCSDIEGDTLILPCDLLAKHLTDTFEEVITDADAVIFTTTPTEYALKNPNSFAWVNGEDNNIQSISIKERNENEDKVLIGSFWVKENQELISHINNIFNNKDTVNGEYYLDSAFKDMLTSGKKVRYVNVENYFSFGTPEEYSQNKYWF